MTTLITRARAAIGQPFAARRRVRTDQDRVALDAVVAHGPIVCATPLLDGAVLLAVGCVVVGFVARRSDIVALGAAPTVFAVVALLLPRPAVPDAALVASVPEAAVGDPVTMQLEISSDVPTRVNVAIRVPAAVVVSDGSAVVELDPQQLVSTHMFAVAGVVPARVRVGPVVAQWEDRLGTIRTEAALADAVDLRISPQVDLVRTLLRAASTGSHVGEQVARRRGDGLEFSDIRPLSPGDPYKRINWRASARRDDYLVSARHPDRNRDVVIVLDGQDELVGVDGRSSLHASMHAAAAIVGAHIATHDRVGFVGLGNAISWVVPSAGVRARHELLGAISDVTANEGSVRRSIDVIPERARPARALLVFVSAFLNASTVRGPTELRRRGLDIAVVIVDPFEFATTSALGRRLWRLDRESIVCEVAEAGIPVATWTHGQPIDAVLREVRTWQQRTPSIGRVATG